MFPAMLQKAQWGCVLETLETQNADNTGITGLSGRLTARLARATLPGMERPRTYTKAEWRALSWQQRKAHADAWRRYKRWRSGHPDELDAAADKAESDRIARGNAYRKAKRDTIHAKPVIRNRRLPVDQGVTVAQMYPHLFGA